ncbi:MAG: DUF2149 domain-containing protein [Methanobrevibacter sp.]|jgi:hypothetical protein|nr:DUF2149 domain-containing protein [Candidatus Methanovirga aequatorialis]
MVKRRKKRSQRIEEDPMAGTTNLVDVMLVISVGLLIFLVMSWNMQSIAFNGNMTQEQKKDQMKSVSQIDQGKELDQMPDTSNGSGQGMVEVGKVYKDPKTGKLVMVE